MAVVPSIVSRYKSETTRTIPRTPKSLRRQEISGGGTPRFVGSIAQTTISQGPHTVVYMKIAYTG